MEILADLLHRLEDLPSDIAWPSFVGGAVMGGLAITGALLRKYWLLLLLVGIPALCLGLAYLLPPSLIPGYTLTFYVAGLIVLVGVAFYIA